MPNDNVLTDNFRGDNAQLVRSIEALLELDAEGALVPHGVGGHARALLSAAAIRLAAHPGQPEPRAEVTDDTLIAIIERHFDHDYPDGHRLVGMARDVFRAASGAAAQDTERLNWLRDETCDLCCIDVPTGGGDSDVRWVVVQHHMSQPIEREIGRSYSEDPREAIDAARTGASS